MSMFFAKLSAVDIEVRFVFVHSTPDIFAKLSMWYESVQVLIYEEMLNKN